MTALQKLNAELECGAEQFISMFEWFLKYGADNGRHLVVDQDVLHLNQLFFFVLQERNPQEID